MNVFSAFLDGINDLLWSYLLVGAFVILGGYFSIKTGFLQVRFLREVVRLLLERPKNGIGISAFRSFNLSLASRVGASNILGTATAIGIGGPGAVFWMWLIAFLGIGISFVENTLGQVYKEQDEDLYRGGPAHYLKKGLGAPKFAMTYVLVFLFSFGIIFNLVQGNIVSESIRSVYSINAHWAEFLLIIPVAFVIFGGLRRIVYTADIMVPVMIVTYLGACFYIIGSNLDKIPEILLLICNKAFGVDEVIGAGIGVALVQGTSRSFFSNETGLGSVAIAAATVNTSHPAKQGIVQSFGILVDTMLFCTSTAIVILLAGLYGHGEVTNGILLTQASMSMHIGELAPYFVSFTLIFFAFTSIISNYYYGEVNIRYLSKKRVTLQSYRFFVLLMLMIGPFLNITNLWRWANLGIGLLTILNLIGLFFLGKIALKVYENYLIQRRAGKNPIFYAEDIPEIGDVACWKKPEHLRENHINDAYFKAMPKE